MDRQPHNDDSLRARWVRTSVEVFEHDIFAGDVFSRRDAWLWLIANAAWKPRRFRASGSNAFIELQRGQVLAARGYLAQTWGWGEKQVRNFVHLLEKENMIKMDQSKGRFANVVTICNYEKYQTANYEKGQLNGQFGASSGPVEGQTLTNDTNITNREDTPLPPAGAVSVEKALPKFGKLQALEAFNAYNAIALRCGLPQAARLTPDRERKIIARLKEYDLTGWHKALANIEKSQFLTGGTDKGFRADLDFVCQAKSFGKLHDGGYGNGRHTAVAPTSKPASVFAHPQHKDEEAEYRATLAWAQEMGLINERAN
jgi:hypothetical protein